MTATTTTITLEFRIFYVRRPEHTGRDCLCNDCWREYLAWHERNGLTVRLAA